MTTLSDFQARVASWATLKGWMDMRILDRCATETEAEQKLARIALAHISLDELAELVRKDPSTDISHHPCVAAPLPAATQSDDCNVIIVLSKLALVHTENTEAAKALLDTGLLSWRDDDGKPEGLGSELSDIVIRCFQLAANVGIDLAVELERKADFNDTRPYMHGKHA